MKNKLKGLLALWLTALLLFSLLALPISAFTITFHANGGSGTMAPQEVPDYTDAVLSKNTFTRSGYTFSGWKYTYYSSGVPMGERYYDDEEELFVYENMDLYAVWEQRSPSASGGALVVKHDCESVCDVCGGCTDLDCNFPKCAEKCRLLVVRMVFSDVRKDAWYTDSVGYVYHHRIMEGVAKGRFGVNDSTTRAMIVTMLWRLAGEPVVNYAMPFTDVEADAYYTEAVRWAASEGVVIGVAADKFAPEMNVTREQMAAILFRYAKHENKGPTGAWAIRLDYPDLTEVAGYASEAVMFCTMKKIVQGREDGRFAPRADATRAEIAVAFHNYMEME